MKVKVAQLCLTLFNLMDYTVHGDSPGRNTRAGCHFLLQGIFPTQGSNPSLLLWQMDSLPLEPPGKPTCNYTEARNLGLPRWLSGEESACQCRRCRRRGFDPWVGKIPWRRKWQPTPVFLPAKFHGQRSLVSYSPWGHKQVGHN